MSFGNNCFCLILHVSGTQQLGKIQQDPNLKKNLKDIKKPQTVQKNTPAPNSPKRSKPTGHFLETLVFKASPPSPFLSLNGTVHQSSTDLL